MRIVYDEVPDVVVLVNGVRLFKIDTMKYLNEQDDKVILRCAEHVKEFERGFTCDFECNYATVNAEQEEKEEQCDDIRDLVLVHINKVWSLEDRFPQFEYVFYK
jgi:hypothetical protein